LVFENGLLARKSGFGVNLGRIWAVFSGLYGRFYPDFCPLAHFLPTFKTWIWPQIWRFGHRKTQYLCGFAGFEKSKSPLAHFFS
jgi:hypothetical protein